MTTEAITVNDDTTADRDTLLARLDAMGKQLDHVDSMLHDALRILAELEPLLPLVPDLAPRALALIDPGAALRKHLPFMNRGGKDVG